MISGDVVVFRADPWLLGEGFVMGVTVAGDVRVLWPNTNGSKLYAPAELVAVDAWAAAAVDVALHELGAA